jgi:hypothetical protein
MDNITGGEVEPKRKVRVKVLRWGETKFVDGFDIGTENVAKIEVDGRIVPNSELMSDVLVESRTATNS